MQAWVVRYRRLDGSDHRQPMPSLETANDFAARVRGAGETVLDVTGPVDWEQAMPRRAGSGARGAVGRRL